MLPVGFEPTIPGSERPQTHALDRAATGTGTCLLCAEINYTVPDNIAAVGSAVCWLAGQSYEM